MPKMKTNSSAKKRFRVTASGKVKRNHAYKSHLLTRKETKRKKRLMKASLVAPSDIKRVKAMLHI
ncbi:MAG: 50S ribosomal protein L35 [Sphingobacteriales bacterium]|jgi:large subunit ribosomal protein L35|nr:50S ribosomal protein L35 [Sphingobacteriales bacterium]MBP9140792.1 50S ribosomal protein L35 [Chitinophagales bacterium]MDA0199425.1 50S ribosomal protein L35 [Bacteroidota bacterium]MBK6889760.1 50S ribosomal protein L35 [Sphingobacteriales bacterium]MBK7527726.1 50S ribosomal protein L35 [Sphingobacteriales bacterium]